MGHLREAARLASTFPTLEQRLTFTLNTEMDMAALEANRGELDQPLTRLVRIEPEADHADPLLKLRFESEFGKLRLRETRYAEARTLLPARTRMLFLLAKRCCRSRNCHPVWRPGWEQTGNSSFACWMYPRKSYEKLRGALHVGALQRILR
jgi:hypothetical protein